MVRPDPVGDSHDLPLWASLANIDSGWSMYEFAALYAAIVWISRGDRRWLVLGALLAGLSLHTKYLALAGCGTASLLITVHSLHSERPPLRSVWLYVGILGSVGAPGSCSTWQEPATPCSPLCSVGSGGIPNA